ncbi:hypothetical protein FGB62_28g228 [Gracilaria domingensis]|nr:hypothetical protein FGB62_28g228 [Gracilaria domingensis]
MELGRASSSMAQMVEEPGHERNRNNSKGIKTNRIRPSLCLSISVILIYAGGIMDATQHAHTSLLPTAKSFSERQSFQTNLPFETLTSRQMSSWHRGKDPYYRKKLNKLLKILVVDYTSWHRKQRKLCDEDPSHAHSVPLLVFRGGRRNYGLGDQIRALLYTYLAAVVTKRLFLIDLRYPFPLSDVLTNPPRHNFTYDASIFLGKGEEETEIRGRREYPDISMYFNPARVLVERSQPSFWVRTFYRVPKHYPQLEYSKEIEKAGLRWFNPGQSVLAPFLLQGLFVSSPAYRELLEERNPFRDEEYLASHARFGIGVGERERRFNLTLHGLTLRTASICFGQIVGFAAKEWSLDKVFFASDTANTSRWVKEGIHDILPNATVVAAEGPAMHLNRMRDRREEHHYEAFQNVFVDLGLLARAKRLVALKSGFSRLAGWYGGLYDRNTIQVNWGVCPLLGIGSKAVGRHCGEAHERIRIRTLLDEKIHHRWEVGLCE